MKKSLLTFAAILATLSIPFQALADLDTALECKAYSESGEALAGRIYVQDTYMFYPTNYWVLFTGGLLKDLPSKSHSLDMTTEGYSEDLNRYKELFKETNADCTPGVIVHILPSSTAYVKYWSKEDIALASSSIQGELLKKAGETTYTGKITAKIVNKHRNGFLKKRDRLAYTYSFNVKCEPISRADLDAVIKEDRAVSQNF